MPDPVVMKTVAMKENNVPLMDRCLAFPWLLGDLIFPFMMEYMVNVNSWLSFNATNDTSFPGTLYGKPYSIY